MKEVSLSELEVWYKDQLKNRFKKEHKVLKQLMDQIQKEIAETKNALKTWPEPRKASKKGEVVEPLDEKSQAILERFVERIIAQFNEMKLPSVHNELNYDNCQDFLASIRTLYAVYNDVGKKSIPKFQKQYNIEIKELDMHLRKLGEIGQKIEVFLRKNYQEGKAAEGLVNKIPRLQTSIDRIGQIKIQIEQTDTQFQQMKQTLKQYEDQLIEISKDELLIKAEELEKAERQKSAILDEELKFKKAFKKLRKTMEKGKFLRSNINEGALRGYTKDAVEYVVREGPNINDLRDLLIKLRIILEDESDPLEIKGELKDKMLENIDLIINKDYLKPFIEELQQIKADRQSLQIKINEKGIENQRNEIKEKLSQLTQDAEHFENDLNRRKREYRELIEKVSSDREELLKAVKEQTGEDIKLKIVIPT
jgi:DNA repair exonuclease SbcCD ATPase subunit